jgi:hypothetical protein
MATRSNNSAPSQSAETVRRQRKIQIDIEQQVAPSKKSWSSKTTQAALSKHSKSPRPKQHQRVRPQE